MTFSFGTTADGTRYVNFNLTWTNPTAAKDPNFWFTRITVQTVDAEGNPGGMFATETVNCEEDGYGRVVTRRNWGWPIPGDKYNIFRLRVYCCSQKTKEATLQTAVSWFGGAPADHYDWNPNAAEAPTSGNLIVNPGFEADGAGWSYTGAVTFVAGGRSGKCAQVAPSGVGNYQQITQEWIPCKPGEALQLSLWAKALAATNGTASGLLRFYNADRSAFNDVSTFSYVNAQTNWTQYTASAIVPADRYWALAYVIYVANGTSGGWLIDDVELIRQVPGDLLADLAVSSAKLAESAVITSKLAVGAVDNWRLGNLAVDARTLANSAVESTKIANLAVGAAAIAYGAVGTLHLGTGIVQNAHIQDASIQAAKIASVAAASVLAGTIIVNTLMQFSGSAGIQIAGGGNVSVSFGKLLTDMAVEAKNAGLGWAMNSGYGALVGNTNSSYVEAPGGYRKGGNVGITQAFSIKAVDNLWHQFAINGGIITSHTTVAW